MLWPIPFLSLSLSLTHFLLYTVFYCMIAWLLTDISSFVSPEAVYHENWLQLISDDVNTNCFNVLA
jgi:hypothetical protein